MPSTPEFDEAYKRLNPEQRSAVDSINGPVFVIAGPGTGKTQILTLRIANILRLTDTPPETILALTFTEAGASEMRTRLSRLIGSRGNRVRIHTFHSFANSLVAQYPDIFVRIAGSQIATDVEQAEMIDEALLHTDLQYLRPFGAPLLYHSYVSNAIATMKRENVTPDALQTLIATNKTEYEKIPGKMHAKGAHEGKLKGEFEALTRKHVKTRDLLTVYKAYEAELTKRHRYDFEGVILETIRAFSDDEGFRREVQEAIFYVHADEHQDANKSQNALLEMLVAHDERPNLFVVGDEKQAIYRFQGADLDNMHYFRDRFPDTRIIVLVANYRSRQTILDSALSLITASPDERLSRVKLVANSEETKRKRETNAKVILASASGLIREVACSSPTAELDFLALEIQVLLNAGIQAEEIVVLARRNQDVRMVAEGLLERGIQVGGGTENAMHNRFVVALIRLLEAIVEPRDEALGALFSLPGFRLSGADVWRIMDAAKREKMPALDLLKHAKVLESARVSDVEGALELRRTIDKLSQLAVTERPTTVAAAALKASGIMDSILAANDRSESVLAIRQLLTTFEELSNREHSALLPRALELLKLYEERNIPLTKASEDIPGLVRIMTVHRAKGREFGYVYVARLTDRAWSVRNRVEHFYLPGVLTGNVELEDERRLLYVAITRAKQACVLSYATTREDGKEEPSCALLEELDSTLVKREAFNATSTSNLDLLEKQTARAGKLLKHDATEPSEDDLKTLRAAFFAQGLSSTALNNYLNCPWHYFYVNLFRIPEVENKFMIFGTAVHAALKAYADRRQRGEAMGVDYLIGTFTRQLSRSALSERDITEIQTKGERALKTWWNLNANSWPDKTEAELALEVVISLDNEELKLRGNLDRVDTIPNGVRVTDYKTGKQRSRNEIIGKTSSGNGDYYRQLTFYKLLLAKAAPSRAMVEGVIEFVEPDEKGNLRAEVFEISDAEMQELVDLIKKTAQEILTFSFWKQTCDNEECKWCPLRFGV